MNRRKRRALRWIEAVSLVCDLAMIAFGINEFINKKD